MRRDLGRLYLASDAAALVAGAGVRFPFLRTFAGEVKIFQDIAAESEKIFAVALARTFQSNRDGTLDPTWARRHDHDSIAHVDGFVDVMGNEEHGRAASLSECQHFVLHPHSGERIERA